MTHRPAAAAAAVLLNLAAVAFFLLVRTEFDRHGLALGPYRVDLDVYRIGSMVWEHGGNLYGPIPRTSAGIELPFSYPPIAAVLLSPLAGVPMAVAGAVLTLVSIGLTGVTLAVFARSLPWSRIGPRAGLAFWWLLPLSLFLEPVRTTLSYGQVNVVLMILVTLDCLAGGPRWKRGVLTGLAAAVKLTPAAFVLFFVLRGDRRAAATSALSFGVVTAAGFALAPGDSVRYWTSVVFDTSRPGNPSLPSNQSLAGLIARAGLGPQTAAGTVAWLGLSAAVAVLAVAGMRRALALGEISWALSLNAFAALLISPISWSHHWVWIAPALLILADLGRRRAWRAGLIACGAGLVIFAVSPPLLPLYAGAGPHWALWQQVAGGSYVIFAVAVLVVSVRLPAVRPAAVVAAEAERALAGARD